MLVENFRPGVMERLGVGFDAMHAQHPRLVYTSVPAYPPGHRFAGRPGYDALVQASSGQQWEQPGWRLGPIFLHMPMPSMGTVFLVPTGILAALIAREETGRGQHVMTSLLQGAFLYTTQIWQYVEHAGAAYHDLMGKSYPPGVHQQFIFECANREFVHTSVMSGLTPKRSQDEILGLEADAVSPNALGAILTEASIAALRTPIVAGGANNQLATPEDGERLHGRGILYAPDYVINAGGIINVCTEYLGDGDSGLVRRRIEGIPVRLEQVWAESASSGRDPAAVADAMAQRLIGRA